MKKLAKELFTENDNETACMARVTWGASFTAICIVAGATVVTGGVVGIAELGIALATIAAGHGAAIKLKK
jgi:hypothetical protein